jgi:hypothetical protein
MYEQRISGKGYNTDKFVFDEDDIETMVKLSASLTIPQIADYFKIGTTTLYNVFKRQPELYASYKKGKAIAIKKMAENLQKHAMKGGSGNMTAAIFYLKTQGRWSEATAETQFEDVVIQTDEEKAAHKEDVKLYTEYKNDREAFVNWKKRQIND